VEERALSDEHSHPLAERLARRLQAERIAGPVLEVAPGSGRNTRALMRAGLQVVSIPDAVPYTQLPARNGGFAAAISTHAYLHGNLAKLRAGIAELKRVLAPGAPAALVFGSISDERFGFGLQIDEVTFAPGDGDEAGVPHAFLDRDGIYDLLAGFDVDSLEEADASQTAGAWAHAETDLGGRRHWFVEARKSIA
jgi:hypothetical protein